MRSEQAVKSKTQIRKHKQTNQTEMEENKKMPQTIITLGLLGELSDVNKVLAFFTGSHGRSETKELGFAIQCGFFGGSGSKRRETESDPQKRRNQQYQKNKTLKLLLLLIIYLFIIIMSKYLFFFAVQKDSGLNKIDIQICRVLEIIPGKFSPIVACHVYHHNFFVNKQKEKSFLPSTN